MDDLDQRLLAALRRDGRASHATLAGVLGVTRATVRARIERLMQSGRIEGFTVVAAGDRTERPVRGVIQIAIDGKGTGRVIARLEGLPSIATIHTTHGRWDLVAEFGADTLDELDTLLTQIRTMDGVTSSETSLFLSTRRAGAVR